MPNIENLETKPSTDRTLQVRRHEILYREDIKTSFGYAMTGIIITLAVAGTIYTVGKKLLS
jgi:hypothetical protein